MNPLGESNSGVRGAVAESRDAMVVELLARWQEDRILDARELMRLSPDVPASHKAWLDVIYEEFAQRQEAGEAISNDAFLDGFPEWRYELAPLLSFDRDLGIVTSKIDLASVQWPEVGGFLVGLKIHAQLGAGAFGRVYLARDPELGNRQVVLKVTPRGRHEARLLGILSHPNIVPVHSIERDETSRRDVIRMPYVGRTTLLDVIQARKDRIPKSAEDLLAIVRDNEGNETKGSVTATEPKDRRPWVDLVIEWGAQLAEALAHAHSQEIGHGDLKPSNVLISREGRPLLLDFNLSNRLGMIQAKAAGTFEYMAPEQLRSWLREGSAPWRVDPRCDIFSLGLILYELLAGTSPFGFARFADDRARLSRFRSVTPDAVSGEAVAAHARAASFAASNFQDSNSPVPNYEPKSGSTRLSRSTFAQLQLALQSKPIRPLRRVVRGVDKPLNALIEKSLALDPDQRVRSAAEFARELRKLRSGRARARRWAKTHRKSAILACAAGLSLIVASIAWWAGRPSAFERHLAAGQRAFSKGDYSEAFESYTFALRADPQDATARAMRGLSSMAVEDFVQALDDFVAASKLSDDPRLLVWMGDCEGRMYNWGGAALFYRQAIAKGVERAEVYNNLARSLRHQTGSAEARDSLNIAIELDPTLQVARYNRAEHVGQLALSKHRPTPKEFFEDIERAIELGPVFEGWLGMAALFNANSAKDDKDRETRGVRYLRMALEHGARLENLPDCDGLRARAAAEAKIPANQPELSAEEKAREKGWANTLGLAGTGDLRLK